MVTFGTTPLRFTPPNMSVSLERITDFLATVPLFRELPRAVKPGVALIAASACAAAISLLREPVGSFIDGAVELNQRRGATIDPLSVGVTATGALAGAVVGARAAKLMSFGGPIRLGLIGAGLAILAAIAWRASRRGAGTEIAPAPLEGG